MANLPYDCYDWDSIDESDPKDELIYSCAEYVKDIMKMLYSNDPLDRTELEDMLFDLCKLLKVKLPDNFLNIERRSKNALRDFFSGLDMKSLYVTKKTI